MKSHLAQLNIGRFRAPKGDPRMADFFDNLDRINAAAERMPGFVWRLKDESGNATDIPWAGDPAFAVNLTVWESVEALERYVYQTVHKRFYGRREEWFDTMAGPHLVLWWIPAGHTPTLQEAKERLEHLAAHGPSDHAFGWEGVAAAQLWKTARCAAPGGRAA